MLEMIGLVLCAQAQMAFALSRVWAQVARDLEAREAALKERVSAQ